MLCDWYQPEQNSVWVEPKVFDKLIDLKLAPEQQSSVDSGIHIDQWALGKSQVAQPFNDLQRRLIYSLNASCQASTILLTNAGHMADHHHAIYRALSNAAQGAFLPTRKRDLYLQDPAPTVFGDLDLSYQGLIFLDSGLEAPDLESIIVSFS